MNYSFHMSLRVPVDLLQVLDKKVEEKKYPNRTEAILNYIQIGLHVESFKTSIKDPEFLKTIDELKQGDSLFEWAETMTDDQRSAIASAIKFVQENKFTQQKFV